MTPAPRGRRTSPGCTTYPGIAALPRSLWKSPDGGRHGRARRGRELHFDGDEAAGGLDHEVHFRPRRRAPEVDLGVHPSMRQGPDDFGQHSRFHDGAAHGPGGGMRRVLEARQRAERTDVGEIYLRSLDEPFPDVGEVRAQHDDLVGGFQYGEPGLDGVERNPEIAGDVCHVQKLRTASRQHAEKPLILGQVSHLPDRTHVALEVGLDVAGMPEGNIAVRLDRELRVPASQEALPQRAKGIPRLRRRPAPTLPGKRRPRPPLRLPPRQRQQAEHGRTAGQRFGHLFGKQQVLRPGQQVLTIACAVRVDDFLDVGKQVGGVLDLVEDGGRWVQVQKAARVFRGGCANIRRLQ